MKTILAIVAVIVILGLGLGQIITAEFDYVTNQIAYRR